MSLWLTLCGTPRPEEGQSQVLVVWRSVAMVLTERDRRVPSRHGEGGVRDCIVENAAGHRVVGYVAFTYLTTSLSTHSK